MKLAAKMLKAIHAQGNKDIAGRQSNRLRNPCGA